ncbi:unnamed protein product, partial [Heterotrigona itama]
GCHMPTNNLRSLLNTIPRQFSNVTRIFQVASQSMANYLRKSVTVSEEEHWPRSL